MSSLYASADLDACRSRNHKFRLTWSDKTPLKMSMQCETCTLASGKSTYVAYGVEQGSFGQWRRAKREEAPEVENVE